MRLAGSAALLLLLLQPLCAAAVTTISNTAIRRDQYGTPATNPPTSTTSGPL